MKVVNIITTNILYNYKYVQHLIIAMKKQTMEQQRLIYLVNDVKKTVQIILIKMVHKRIFVFHIVITLKHHKANNCIMLIQRKKNVLNLANIIDL